VKTITLHGHRYNAHSPSMLNLVGTGLWIGCNGRTWQIGMFQPSGAWGLTEFKTRDIAASWIAAAFARTEFAG
jgi:hypothetical protein